MTDELQEIQIKNHMMRSTIIKQREEIALLKNSMKLVGNDECWKCGYGDIGLYGFCKSCGVYQ